MQVKQVSATQNIVAVKWSGDGKTYYVSLEHLDNGGEELALLNRKGKHYLWSRNDRPSMVAVGGWFWVPRRELTIVP